MRARATSAVSQCNSASANSSSLQARLPAKTARMKATDKVDLTSLKVKYTTSLSFTTVRLRTNQLKKCTKYSAECSKTWRTTSCASTSFLKCPRWQASRSSTWSRCVYSFAKNHPRRNDSNSCSIYSQSKERPYGARTSKTSLRSSACPCKFSN